MKTPTHEEISQRAQEIWRNEGQPAGRDDAIWLEAERQLSAGRNEAGDASAARETQQTTSESKGATALASRIKSDTAAEVMSEYHISPPVSDDEAIKAGMPGRSAPNEKRAGNPSNASRPAPVPAKTGGSQSRPPQNQKRR